MVQTRSVQETKQTRLLIFIILKANASSLAYKGFFKRIFVTRSNGDFFPASRVINGEQNVDEPVNRVALINIWLTGSQLLWTCCGSRGSNDEKIRCQLRICVHIHDSNPAFIIRVFCCKFYRIFYYAYAERRYVIYVCPSSF